MAKIALATVILNEARWLPEWLEYHLAIGVQHAYLYDDGSTDALSATLFPYIAQGKVTLHLIAEIGPLPHKLWTPLSRKRCEEREQRSRQEHLSRHHFQNGYHFQNGSCWRYLDFPQQVLMVRHAITHYDHTDWIAFIDVDEFLALPWVPDLLHGLQSAGGVGHVQRPSATEFGGVRLKSIVMLPRTTATNSTPRDDILLTRYSVRRMPKALYRREASYKTIVRPSAVNLTIFGSIHGLALRAGHEYAYPVSGTLHIVHFRYRFMESFNQRLGRKYLTGNSTAVANKRFQMRHWKKQLLAAAHNYHIEMHTPLVRFVNRVYWGLHDTWAGPWQRPGPVAAILHASKNIASRRGVLLAAVGRSGSTLLGRVAFDSHPSFIYLYEPCRMRGPTDNRESAGKRFGQRCLDLARRALSCSLPLAEFKAIARDRAFYRQSRVGAILAAKFSRISGAVRESHRHNLFGELDGPKGPKGPSLTHRRWRSVTGAAGAAGAGSSAGRSSGSREEEPTTQNTLLQYINFLCKCWVSHRAVKLIRLESLQPSSLIPEHEHRMHVLHLVRSPQPLVASRLSLPSFRLASPFNPTGTQRGVVNVVCREMTRALPRALLPQQRTLHAGPEGLLLPAVAAGKTAHYVLLRLENFVASPLTVLQAVYGLFGISAPLQQPQPDLGNALHWDRAAAGKNGNLSTIVPAAVMAAVQHCIRRKPAVREAGQRRRLAAIGGSAPVPAKFDPCSGTAHSTPPLNQFMVERLREQCASVLLTYGYSLTDSDPPLMSNLTHYSAVAPRPST